MSQYKPMYLIAKSYRIHHKSIGIHQDTPTHIPPMLAPRRVQQTSIATRSAPTHCAGGGGLRGSSHPPLAQLTVDFGQIKNGNGDGKK